MFNASERVLILAPSENDSRVAAIVLHEADITAVGCLDIKDLCEQIFKGCGVIVIAEEALPNEQLHLLEHCLQHQQPWSDLPVILMTGQGTPRGWESFSASGNISLLERPFSRLTLIRAVQVALRARRKQYQVQQLLAQQEQAALKRDEFFATLSHELRTPLNVILGWTELLRTGDLNPDARADALAILERNAQMQKALIDDLLDTSRIITGKLHFEATPFSLTNLLGSLAKTFTPRAREKNIKVELHLPDGERPVYADESRMTQVITNLITNSIKFTAENGIIQIFLEESGGQYQVRVKDNGRGIDPTFLPYVFDRLKQEDMSTTRAHGGLGLGLAISAYIVQQHGGKLVARSDGRGKGSEFILTLPVYKEPLKAAKPAAPLATLPLDDLRVLVVDDSPDILTLINLWLMKTHATVKLTSSAREALEAISTFKPDVLLSDIGMPEMDGYEPISRVRNHTTPSIRNVPAIALTAYAKDEERARALKAGFQMHISKPISSDQLLTAVSSLASASLLKRELH